ncbi:TMV resistance protein N, partial [Tanacetum coccineum]
MLDAKLDVLCKVPVGHDMCSEVLKSIEDSEMYVVVFSHNYASSVRSLDELANIMDRRGKKIVYPVFYKLQPSDVKLRQEGPFKEAFQALEADDETNPERVDMWKKALRDACKLAGSTLHING